jgi:type II secretory pathway pseudopilin PulG
MNSALNYSRVLFRTRQARGFALIDLVFVCGLIGLLASISAPPLLRAKEAAGSASAIGSLRAINSAELTYALTCGSGFYAPSLTTLGTPPPGSNDAFITEGLGENDAPIKDGYVIELDAEAYAGAPGSCNGLDPGSTGRGFRAGADPVAPENKRFFGTNSYMSIYEDVAALFPTMPELGEPAGGRPIN